MADAAPSGPGWRPLPPLPVSPQRGRFVHHEMLNPRKHGPDLWEALGGAKLNDMTKWLFWPHIDSREQFIGHLSQLTKKEGRRSWLGRLTRAPVLCNVYAILNAETGEVMGMRCYTAPDRRHRTVETGPMIKGPAMSRSVYSTESAYLSACRAFDEWGCRRYVARCDSENIPARKTILRLGFKEEGTFRNYRIYGGKNHHTIWYSITAEEWPPIKRALELFLSPDNLGPDLKARRRLQDIREELLTAAPAGHGRA